MSLFNINTNTTAMNALYNVNQTSNSLSQSIQRLSTGLRINSAADDPAGLIISKQFQAQITGINQAISNSQDAMNYAKTAEGSMSSINDLLNTAYGLAVAASNTGTLSQSQVQADSNQLQSIVNSISTIAQNAQYGTKHLLDGSAGVTASITNSADISSLNIGGSFGGAAITAASSALLTVTTAATKAVVTLSVSLATAGSLVGADTFTLNGQSFSTSASSTTTDVLNAINAASDKTGVTASYTTGGPIVLTQSNYGSNNSVNFADAGGKLNAGSSSAAGVDAVATLKIGSSTVTFTGGLGGANGVTLSDGAGNSFSLTAAGNAVTVTNANVGQITVGTSQFQIGANAGQTTSLSLGNFQASSLGTGAVSGLNLSNIDISTASNASNAMQVIQAAINQVSTARGNIGAFEADTLNPNLSALNSASQNLSASMSAITDTNVAQEMTNFTRLQILQQAGMSVLAQANSAPQSVLKLLP